MPIVQRRGAMATDGQKGNGLVPYCPCQCRPALGWVGWQRSKANGVVFDIDVKEMVVRFARRGHNSRTGRTTRSSRGVTMTMEIRVHNH